MKTQTTINWSQAQEVNKQAEAEKQTHAKEYAENLDNAINELNDAMGTPDFRYSDMENIAFCHGVEQDDLIFNLI